MSILAGGCFSPPTFRIDDDHMEPAISYRISEDNQDRFLSLSPSVSPASRTTALSPVEVDADVGPDLETAHGVRFDGRQAACGLHRHRFIFEATVDCEACTLKSSRELLTITEISNECREVLKLLRDVGQTGISKADLLVGLFVNHLALVPLIRFLEARVHSSPKLVVRCVKMLTSASMPLAFWAGYVDPAVLVGSQYISAWAIKIPIAVNETAELSRLSMTTEPEADGQCGDFTYVFPRRWKDIHGRVLQNLWDAALRAVMSHIWLRPGICEARTRKPY